MSALAHGVKHVVQTVLGVFTPKAPAPIVPDAVKTPAVMPTPDDDAVKAARRRQAAEVAQRSGRASTVLSQDDKLGG